MDNRSGQDKLAIFLAFAIKKLPIPQVTARLKLSYGKVILKNSKKLSMSQLVLTRVNDKNDEKESALLP